MVSSSGDPMVFIPLKDAQEAQFLEGQRRHLQSDGAALQIRHSTDPAAQALLDAVIASQSTNAYVNSVLVQIKAGSCIRAKWPNRSAAGSVLTSIPPQPDGRILVGKLIATSAKQIGMFSG